MKKIITALMLLMLSVPMLRSQSSEEHLKFKGIPITGSKENFVKQLKKQGFKNKYLSDDFLIGEFVGEECTLSFNTTPNSKILYKVTVWMPEHKYEIHLAHRDCNGVKELLMEKYKIKPSVAEPREGYIMYIFKLEHGDITLWVDIKDYQTVLTYTDYKGEEIKSEEDRINYKKKKERDIQDL
jgi:hypothetical protein